jgi:hypothetical protein
VSPLRKKLKRRGGPAAFATAARSATPAFSAAPLSRAGSGPQSRRETNARPADPSGPRAGRRGRAPPVSVRSRPHARAQPGLPGRLSPLFEPSKARPGPARPRRSTSAPGVGSRCGHRRDGVADPPRIGAAARAFQAGGFRYAAAAGPAGPWESTAATARIKCEPGRAHPTSVPTCWRFRPSPLLVRAPGRLLPPALRCMHGPARPARPRRSPFAPGAGSRCGKRRERAADPPPRIAAAARVRHAGGTRYAAAAGRGRLGHVCCPWPARARVPAGAGSCAGLHGLVCRQKRPGRPAQAHVPAGLGSFADWAHVPAGSGRHGLE